MRKLCKDMPIGFFDSGVGGLSVMRKAVEMLPNESLVYFGDSKNAPYGVKSKEEVQKLSFNAAKFLIAKGAKAIVVACNTATSAAIKELRREYSDMPIIGIEPAVKPAVEFHKKGIVVIMATKLTLSQKKFEDLYNENDNIKMVPMACSKLVELVEKGITSGEELEKYLTYKFKDLNPADIETVVLGCTHYPFVKNTLQKILGDDVNIIDGSEGTVKQLKRKLAERDLLKTKGERTIEIYNSLESKEIIDLSYKLIAEK